MNKEEQKQLITDIMNADAKNGLYKQQTAVEWFFDNLKSHEIQAEHLSMYEQAKAMEKEQIVEFAWGCQEMFKHQIIEKFNEKYGE